MQPGPDWATLYNGQQFITIQGEVDLFKEMNTETVSTSNPPIKKDINILKTHTRTHTQINDTYLSSAHCKEACSICFWITDLCIITVHNLITEKKYIHDKSMYFNNYIMQFKQDANDVNLTLQVSTQ